MYCFRIGLSLLLSLTASVGRLDFRSIPMHFIDFEQSNAPWSVNTAFLLLLFD